MPTVTVAIPNFNGERFLAQAISSVLAQTFRDFELLVVDDASTDGSARLAARFTADPRVRFVTNPVNLGLTGNWLRCLELAQGEFVALLHQDDLWQPEFLADMSGLLRHSPAAHLALCAYHLIDQSGAVLPQQPHPQPDGSLTERDYEALLAAQYIQAPSWLARRSLFQAVSYDPRFRFAVDWDFYLRAIGPDPSRVVSTSRMLASFRVHLGSESYQPQVLRLRLREEKLVLEEALARRTVSSKACRNARTALAARQAGLVARQALAGRPRSAVSILADGVAELGVREIARGFLAGLGTLGRADARRALLGG